MCIFSVTSSASGSLLSLQYVQILIYMCVAKATCKFANATCYVLNITVKGSAKYLIATYIRIQPRSLFQQ